jgi:tetratricopeptide (TPR) repeat protein
MAPVPHRKNAIERRLEELEERWNAFAEDPTPRLLRWAVEAQSLAVVEGFVELQRDGDGDVPDYFLRFDEPFVDPRNHGFVLTAALERAYGEARPGLADAGFAAWSAPGVRLGEPDVAAFARYCATFQAHHAPMMLRLAVVLAPEAVTDAMAWQRWLLALVRADVPEGVRFVLLDPAEAPQLDALCAAEPRLVRSEVVDLDMPAAIQELANAAAGDDPGSQFRVHFVALTNAAGRSPLPAAGEAAQRALAIATQHGWSAMQVVVYSALASAYLGAGHADSAVAAYQAARAAALEAGQQGDPSAPTLVVQSWLGEGAAYVSAGRFAEGAPVYEAAAPVAAACGNGLMTLEGWRMAAYCHEQAGDADAAWRCGQQALDAGAALDDATRDVSTLPFAGQGLLRVAQRWAYASEADAVRARLAALLGPNWESRAPQPA